MLHSFRKKTYFAYVNCTDNDWLVYLIEFTRENTLVLGENSIIPLTLSVQ